MRLYSLVVEKKSRVTCFVEIKVSMVHQFIHSLIPCMLILKTERELYTNEKCCC